MAGKDEKSGASGSIKALQGLKRHEITLLRRRRLLDLIGSGMELVDAAHKIAAEFGVKRNTVYQDWTLRRDWIKDIIQADPAHLEDYFAQAFSRLQSLRDQSELVRQDALSRRTTMLTNAEVQEPQVMSVGGKQKVVYNVRRGQKPIEVDDPDYRAAIQAIAQKIKVEELALRIGVVFLDAQRPGGDGGVPGQGGEISEEKRERMVRSAYAMLHKRMGSMDGIAPEPDDIPLYQEPANVPALLPSEVMKAGSGTSEAERRDTLEEVLRD
jgi:hypothetical protein